MVSRDSENRLVGGGWRDTAYMFGDRGFVSRALALAQDGYWSRLLVWMMDARWSRDVSLSGNNRKVIWR